MPLAVPLPPELLALLAVPTVVDGAELPPGQEARVTRLIEAISAIRAELTERHRLLGGRLATVRAARRAGAAAHVIDYRS